MEEKVEEKVEKKPQNGIKVKTESGFEWEITAKLDDARLVDAIALAESEEEADKLIAYKDLKKFLLGKQGTDALYEHIKKITGEDYVPIEKVREEITAIFVALGDQDKEVKN